MSTQLDFTPLLGEESPPVKFPSGLIGLDEWKEFVVLEHPAGGPLRLLQSLEDTRVSFVLTDPQKIDPDHQVKLSDADAQALQYSGERLVSSSEELAVYCILSVQEDPFSVTANLLGPLVINWQTGLGRQVILSEAKYSTCHPVTGSQVAGGE